MAVSTLHSLRKSNDTYFSLLCADVVDCVQRYLPFRDLAMNKHGSIRCCETLSRVLVDVYDIVSELARPGQHDIDELKRRAIERINRAGVDALFTDAKQFDSVNIMADLCIPLISLNDSRTDWHKVYGDILAMLRLEIEDELSQLMSSIINGFDSAFGAGIQRFNELAGRH